MQTVDSNPGSNLGPMCRQLGEYMGQRTATLGHLPSPTLSFGAAFYVGVWGAGVGLGEWVISFAVIGARVPGLVRGRWDLQVRLSCLQRAFADGRCSCDDGPSWVHLAQGPEYKVFLIKSKTFGSTHSQLKVGLGWVRRTLSFIKRNKGDWSRSACDKMNVSN